jgi:chromosome segregation ATPase
MSEKDLVKELKSAITDLTQDRDEALDKIKSKESRMKQVLIKLEHATADVQSLGHKIGDQNKTISDLQAKLETKEKLLEDALDRLKGIHDDSTEKTNLKEIKTEDEDSE